MLAYLDEGMKEEEEGLLLLIQFGTSSPVYMLPLPSEGHCHGRPLRITHLLLLVPISHYPLCPL